jgi:hypothetical protein
VLHNRGVDAKRKLMSTSKEKIVIVFHSLLEAFSVWSTNEKKTVTRIARPRLQCQISKRSILPACPRKSQKPPGILGPNLTNLPLLGVSLMQARQACFCHSGPSVWGRVQPPPCPCASLAPLFIAICFDQQEKIIP